MTAVVLAVVLAGGLAADVSAMLSQEPRLTGAFTQTKVLRGFKRPLVSKGTFSLRRAEGLTWTTEAPFQSRLEVRPGAITTTQREREVLRLDAREQPELKDVTDLLFSVVGGDVGGLSERFTVEGRVSPAAWSLTLTPRALALKGFIARLDLEGDRYVRAIRIVEASGDESRITLTDVRADP
ncbi:MAG: outer membrane lipoprotein carrier protein LolA [Myxococcaceae bacterium]|nr:outer membrane lipoprotein carrier protein LolA [Myxococcaceae bacterium]